MSSAVYCCCVCAVRQDGSSASGRELQSAGSSPSISRLWAAARGGLWLWRGAVRRSGLCPQRFTARFFSSLSSSTCYTLWHKDGFDGWTKLYDAFRKIGKEVRLQESAWCSVGFIYYQLSFRDGHRSTLVSNEIPYEQILDEHTLFFTHIHGSLG